MPNRVMIPARDVWIGDLSSTLGSAERLQIQQDPSCRGAGADSKGAPRHGRLLVRLVDDLASYEDINVSGGWSPGGGRMLLVVY